MNSRNTTKKLDTNKYIIENIRKENKRIQGQFDARVNEIQNAVYHHVLNNVVTGVFCLFTGVALGYIIGSGIIG